MSVPRHHVKQFDNHIFILTHFPNIINKLNFWSTSIYYNLEHSAYAYYYFKNSHTPQWAIKLEEIT